MPKNKRKTKINWDEKLTTTYTKNEVSQIFLQYKFNNRETLKTAHVPGRKRRSAPTTSLSLLNIKKILAGCSPSLWGCTYSFLTMPAVLGVIIPLTGFLLPKIEIVDRVCFLGLSENGFCYRKRTLFASSFRAKLVVGGYRIELFHAGVSLVPAKIHESKLPFLCVSSTYEVELAARQWTAVNFQRKGWCKCLRWFLRRQTTDWMRDVSEYFRLTEVSPGSWTFQSTLGGWGEGWWGGGYFLQSV